jgi:hypothetical protein
MGENVQAEPDEGNGVLFRFDHIGVPGERDIHLKFGMNKKQMKDVFIKWFYELPLNDRIEVIHLISKGWL